MKEIDEFFRDYLRPPLKAAGFRRKGRLFYLVSPLSDVAVVEIRSYPTSPQSLGFWMKAALYPEPFRAFRGLPDEPTDADWGLWSRQIRPDTFGSANIPDGDQGFWDPAGERKHEWGQYLGSLLTTHLIPFLSDMLDRDRLLAAIKSDDLGSGRLLDEFTVLATEGRTPELAAELASIQRWTDEQARRRVTAFVYGLLPEATHADEEAFEELIKELRQARPVSAGLPIIAVTVEGEEIRVRLSETVHYGSAKHPDVGYHARIVASDGSSTPCIAGPSVEVFTTGDRHSVTRVKGVPSDQVVPGSILRVSTYREDEDDHALWDRPTA